MRPVNLIPLDERRGDRAPMRTGPLSYVLVAGLALAFLGVYMLVSTGNAITERESQLTALEQQLQASEARAEALQSFTAFATLEETRTQTVSDLARSRFDWERVMRELALVIPSDVSLTNVTAKVSASAASGSGSGAGGPEAGAGTEGIQGPSLAMAGCATNHDTVARLVAAMRDIDGVTRVGLQSSTTTEEEGSSTGTSSDDSGGSCVKATSFELAVAFDGVAVDPATGAVIPTEPAAPAGDEAGISDATGEQAAAKESAGEASKRGNEAVDRFIPGA